MKTNSLLRRTLAPACALALGIAASTAFAGEDIDIFAAGAGVTPKPNVLLLLDNSSNWSATLGPNACFPATSDTKFHAEVCALQTILGDPAFGANVRLGLMMFTESGANGGYIRYNIRDMNAANKTAFRNMVGSFIQNGTGTDSSGANQPYGKAMFEVFKYFGGYTKPSLAQSNTAASPTGQNAFGPWAYAGWSTDSGSDKGAFRRDYTNNNSPANRAAVYYGADAVAAFSNQGDTDYNYDTTFTDGCAKNFLVVVSNGNPGTGGDSGIDTIMSTISVNPTQIKSGTTEVHASKFDEMAKYLFTTDVSPMAGQQKVITYTIGVYQPNPKTGAISNTDQEMIKLMKSGASAGGGKYFAATNAAEVVQALLKILNEVQAVNSVFVSASLPVSVNTQGTFLNQVYMGMFRPDATASPRWLGNLKEYKFSLDPDTLELFLVDSTGNRAVNPATGFISPTAVSFWTHANTAFWTNNLQGTPLSAYDSPDGEIVEKGGAAQGNRDAYAASQATRRVYTCPSSGCGAGAALSYEFDTTNITGATHQTNFGAASAAELTSLVKWVRGEDNVNGDPAVTGWTTAESGPGLPTTVRPSIHGDVLHSRPVVLNYPGIGPYVFYGANDGTLRGVKGGQLSTDGDESWSFVAPEFYGKFKRLRSGLPALLTPATLPGIIPAPQPKDYFFDGPIGSYQDATKAWIFVAARRGGRVIYAFDVTDPTTPKFMWKIVGGTGDFAELGQTWSEPKAIKTKALCPNSASCDPVLIFGAGYDPVEDLAVPAGWTMGRGIYFVNARTGARIEFLQTSSNPIPATISRPVPSDIAVSDVDGDTYIDRAYVGDTGGYIWRVDLDAATSAGWKLFQFAKTFSSARRKYFYQPDIVLSRDFHMVLFGSGDREKPLANSSNDYFFGLKDTYVGKDATGMAPILRTELSAVNFSACTQPAKGWYLELESSGEKVVNSPLTVAGVTYFSTNKPMPAAPGTCSANLGRARTYALEFLGGCAGSDRNGDGVKNQSDLFVDLTGGGLPPSPVGGIVQLDDGRLVGFVIGGGDSSSPIEAGRVKVNIPKIRQKLYWNSKSDK